MAGEYLSMPEIEEKYPQEWVLIDRPATNPGHEVLGGYVVLHHANLAEFNRLLERTPTLARSALLYVDHPPPRADEVDAISVWTSDSTPG